MYSASSQQSTLSNAAANYSDAIKPSKGINNILEPDDGDESSESSDDEKVYKVNLHIIPIVILEAVTLGSLAVLAYFLRFENTFPVLIRGFYCNDKELSLPGNVTFGSSTSLNVPAAILYPLAVAVPLTLIWLGELASFVFCSKKGKVVRAGCVSCKMHLLTRRIIRFSGTFLFGLLCTSILVDMIKHATGRQRPYFLEACQVNITICTSDTFVNPNHAVCSNHDDNLRDARMSFPSMQSALSAYAAVFTMVYIHNTVIINASHLLRPTLVFAIGSLALLCGISRVTQHKNHWEDVVAGFLLGTVIAVYISKSILLSFHEYYELKDKKCCNQQTHSQNQARPIFFRYFRIPHVTYRSKAGNAYAFGEQDGSDYSPRSLPVNEAFQRDLHQRVEDYGRHQRQHPRPS